MKRMLPTTMLGAALALALSPSAALADQGQDSGRRLGNDVLRAGLTPAVPTDAPVDGVNPGGLPWVIDRGEVRLRVGGRLDIRIEGLQVPRADGTTDNPVASVDAVVYCAGVQVADSGPRPLSVPGGDLRFRTEVDVPTACASPTILISPTPLVGKAYIASAVG